MSEYLEYLEGLSRELPTLEPPFDPLIDTRIPADTHNPVGDEFTVIPDASRSSKETVDYTGLLALLPPFDVLLDIHVPPDEHDPPQDEFIYGPSIDLCRLHEALDGTKSLGLFEGVSIVETDDTTYFEVPERYIKTPSDGIWIVGITGKQRKFKERDDYGDIRFLASGKILWIPHLYPFEEVNENGLPVIMDRERCEVEITLQPVNGEPSNKSLNVALKTPFGELSASEAPESYNPDWISFFTEFGFDGKQLRADLVTYPERQWLSFSDYAAKQAMPLKDYLLTMEGKKPFPEEYIAQKRPNEWYERQPSEYQETAFGSIWVPIDELRKGIVAELSFPCFQNGSCR